MARQRGLIKINGGIDDLVFYRLNGKDIVRQRSGFPKGKSRKNARYKKTVENESDFGKASKTGKAFRQILKKYLDQIGDRTHHSRLVTPLVHMLRQDDEPINRGKRQFAGSDLTSLKGFHFNLASLPFLNKNLINRNSIDISTASATLSGEIYSKSIIEPVSHVQVSQVLLHFNFDDNKGVYHHQDQLLDFAKIITFNSTIAIPPVNDMQAVVQLIFVQFYQNINDQLYPVLPQCSGMCVVGVAGI